MGDAQLPEDDTTCVHVDRLAHFAIDDELRGHVRHLHTREPTRLMHDVVVHQDV